jgi:hypothetical protein
MTDTVLDEATQRKRLEDQLSRGGALLEGPKQGQEGPTEPFWRAVLLNRPMERGSVPTPVALPETDPGSDPTITVPGTQDPMQQLPLPPEVAPPGSKDPMPLINEYFNPFEQDKSTTYL